MVSIYLKQKNLHDRKKYFHENISIGPIGDIGPKTRCYRNLTVQQSLDITRILPLSVRDRSFPIPLTKDRLAKTRPARVVLIIQQARPWRHLVQLNRILRIRNNFCFKYKCDL